MTYKIRPTRGYFEVYINGKFYCSANNMREAIEEIENYTSEGGDYYETQSAC